MKIRQVVRKILVFVTGLPLLVIGLILIPLPGPGVLISFLALLILSVEIPQVQPWLKRQQEKLDHLWQEYKRKQKEIDDKYR